MFSAFRLSDAEHQQHIDVSARQLPEGRPAGGEGRHEETLRQVVEGIRVEVVCSTGSRSAMFSFCIQAACVDCGVYIRGGTIHRCIDISKYFSRDTYRDIIFYNHNFFFFFFIFFFHNDFHLGRKDT